MDRICSLSTQTGAPAAERPVWRQLTIAISLALAGVVALSFDMPLARWCASMSSPRSVRELLETCEAFGNGYGVALIVVAVWLLDYERRVRTVRIVTILIACGLITNLFKVFVGRLRPRELSVIGDSVFGTFVGWLGAPATGPGGHSFPSAHTATAFALALGLAWAYPRGRVLFLLLATFVGMQRVQVIAHFASDVFWGASVGWLVATVFLQRDACWGWFHKLETRAEPPTLNADVRLRQAA